MKFVVSLGGSVINPSVIDVGLLSGLKRFISRSKHDFIFVCGGGSVARDYINAGLKLKVPSVRLDEVGIRATELNAELVASVFGVRRSRSIEEVVSSKSRVVVTNGLFPGVTTDFDAVVIAGLIGADVVINLSNVSGIYDKDPRKFSDALLLKRVSYDKLIELASHFELGLGAHFVFDLAASKLASRTGVKIVCLKGLVNFKSFINGKGFTGSVVS